MTGRQRCDALKKIRKSIADSLNIDLHQKECTYEGECKGTCPKCKSEEAVLNKALLRGAATAGAAVIMAGALAGCTYTSTLSDNMRSDLSGAVDQIEETADSSYDTAQKNISTGIDIQTDGSNGSGGSDGTDETVELTGEVAEVDIVEDLSGMVAPEDF